MQGVRGRDHLQGTSARGAHARSAASWKREEDPVPHGRGELPDFDIDPAEPQNHLHRTAGSPPVELAQAPLQLLRIAAFEARPPLDLVVLDDKRRHRAPELAAAPKAGAHRGTHAACTGSCAPHPNKPDSAAPQQPPSRHRSHRIRKLLRHLSSSLYIASSSKLVTGALV